MTASPDGNGRWAMLALVFAARAGLSLQFQTVGSTGDPLTTELGLSYTELGAVIGAFFLPGLVLSLPAGYAGNTPRTGCWWRSACWRWRWVAACAPWPRISIP